jgi:hypothetical protein
MADDGLARARDARVRRGRRGAAAITALAVVAGLALPVLAARILAVEVLDDTRGLLDVHEVSFLDADGEPPAWTVVTFNRWTTREIWDRGYVVLHLDTLGSTEPDYFVLVRADRSDLVGTMWRDRATDRRLFEVPVRRRGERGVEVQVPLRKLSIGPERTLYRWYVTTLFGGGTCRRTCIDDAPDATMIEQPLPSASPTST